MIKEKAKKRIFHNNKKIIFLIILFFIVDICLYTYFTNRKVQAANLEKEKKIEERIKQKKIAEEKELAIENYKVSFKEGECIFLGDSLTDYYDLEKYYDFPIVNSGKAGYTTDDILEHMEELVYQYNPKVVVILIGTNDIPIGKSVDEIVSSIKEIVDKIKESKPKARIFIQSLYPINDTDSDKIVHEMVDGRKNQMIDDINVKLIEYCDEEKLDYIEINYFLKDKSGNLDLKYTQEGLHISDDGYELITKKIIRYFKERQV